MPSQPKRKSLEFPAQLFTSATSLRHETIRKPQTDDFYRTGTRVNRARIIDRLIGATLAELRDVKFGVNINLHCSMRENIELQHSSV